MLDVDGSSSAPGGGSDGCPMMLFVSVAPTLHDDPRAGFEPVMYEFQDGAGEVRRRSSACRGETHHMLAMLLLPR